MITKVLIVGCGDIGIRLSQKLESREWGVQQSKAGKLTHRQFACTGLRRDPSQLPASIEPLQLDLNAITSLKVPQHFDYVVITLVPMERTDQGYEAAYVANLRKIIAGLVAQPIAPTRVFLVSSTSVYHQANGEWVDEASSTEPTGFSGQRILEGEKLLADSSLLSTIVRFSGIYGPGRLRVIKQVQGGDHGNADEGFSNRIHAEDCAGVLAHLIRLCEEKKEDETKSEIESCYLATDCEPVLLGEVKHWMATAMGLSEDKVQTTVTTNITAGGMNRGNKRCTNQRLLQSGYQFRYPTFREGYGEILKEEGLIKSP